MVNLRWLLRGFIHRCWLQSKIAIPSSNQERQDVQDHSNRAQETEHAQTPTDRLLENVAPGIVAGCTIDQADDGDHDGQVQVDTTIHAMAASGCVRRIRSASANAGPAKA